MFKPAVVARKRVKAAAPKGPAAPSSLVKSPPMPVSPPALPPAQLIEVKGVQLLECPVCENQYGDTCRPKLMPCGHTVCNGCADLISSVADNGAVTLRCPSCSQLRSGQLPNQLPVNFAALEAQQSLLLAMATCESYEQQIDKLRVQLREQADELAAVRGQKRPLDEPNPTEECAAGSVEDLLRRSAAARAHSKDLYDKATMAVISNHVIAARRIAQCKLDTLQRVKHWFSVLDDEATATVDRCRVELKQKHADRESMLHNAEDTLRALKDDDPERDERLYDCKEWIDGYCFHASVPSTMAKLLSEQASLNIDDALDGVFDVHGGETLTVNEEEMLKLAHRDLQALLDAEPLVRDRVRLIKE